MQEDITVKTTTLYGTFNAFLARWRAVRLDSRTRRILSELPRDIRKDIGWPDDWNGPQRR